MIQNELPPSPLSRSAPAQFMRPTLHTKSELSKQCPNLARRRTLADVSSERPYHLLARLLKLRTIGNLTKNGFEARSLSLGVSHLLAFVLLIARS